MHNIIQSFKWRYATKKFDAAKKLSIAQLDTLLEALRLAPSSFGLQPWKFVVVENAALREKIRAAAWNQSQVTDASHLIALAVPQKPNAALVDEYISFMREEQARGGKGVLGIVADEAKLLKQATMMKGFIATSLKEGAGAWVRAQAYIALGFLLAAAAEERIDTCPMEGFDSAKVGELLGLDKHGLEACVLVAAGYRAADDKYAKEAKLRYPKEKVVITIQ